jgi:hypothetical protein
VQRPHRARWIAAVLLILYACAKLTGSQFAPLDSQIARPMRDVSGYWLTWYYFSYSATYGTIIGLIQLAGGVLLAFRRTALLAALMLVPVVVNILLIDIFFHYTAGPTVMATVILVCLLVVIAPNVGRLRDAILPEPAPHRLAPRVAAITVVVATVWTGMWLAVHYIKKRPTPIDGTWSVASQGGSFGASRVQQVFFERNQAHSVIFRSAAGDVAHHFEVGADGVIRVWETLRTKGRFIMQGRVLSDGDIQLDDVNDPAGHLRLRLQYPPRE